MTKHYPKSRTTINEQQEQQPKPKEKGWYCFLHHIKYLCHLCGEDSMNRKRNEDHSKYYFVEED